MPFVLPARIEAVERLLAKQRVMRNDPKRRMEQARRTAWRILKDWVEAQLALIASEMVRLDEVFLPYARTRSGMSVYEALQDGGFSALALSEPSSQS